MTDFNRQITEVLAGKRVRITRRFARADGEGASVNPSTVTVKWRKPDYTVDLTLTPGTNDYAGDNSYFDVVLYWTVPNDALGGKHEIEWFVTGQLTDTAKDVFMVEELSTV